MIAPHLRHTCATHFGKLSEFAKVNQLPRWRKFFPPTAYPSSHTRLRQLADFPSSHTRLCQLADFPSSHTQLRQLANFPSSHTRLCQLTDFPSSHTQLRQLADFPSLILRLSFAYPSLILRLSFAQGSLMIAPHLRHTCATHFGKLSEFAKVNQLRQLTSPPLAQASPPMLILRSTFAQGSMRRINIPPSPLQKGGRCRSSTFKDFLDSFCVAQSLF